MVLNKLVFAGLSIGCLAAAAGGGYLAARHADTGDATPVMVAPQVAAPAEAISGETPVTESEGVITPAAPAPEPPVTRPAERAPRTNRSVAPVAETRSRSARATSAPSTPAATPRRSETRVTRQDRSVETNAPSSGAASAPTPSVGGMWETRPTVTPEPAPALDAEPETPPAPPAPEFIDLVVPADAVIGLQLERTISSENARVEDRVEARVTRDVRVGDKVAIPAGSMVHGSVMEVERGGKVKERAKLGIRFHTIVLSNGTRLPIRTDAVVREGQSPAKESAAKIGGAAVGGAILGAILGGGKGAVIGGATGAAGGTAATMAGERNPAVLTAGTTVSVRVQQPVTVTVEQ